MPEGQPAELVGVENVREGLAAAIGSTWKLANTCERSRALCALYLAALRTIEASEMEQRLRSLEERLGEVEGEVIETPENGRPYLQY